MMEAYAVSRAEKQRCAVRIGDCAWQALLEEVYTTPKPGLVDLVSSGAHTDMDVHTFERSADALRPYFAQMAFQGICMEGTAEELFRQIRKTGMAAEQAMYRATSGVNTHKGLIFTLGIFCAAAGRCLSQYGAVTQKLLRGMQTAMTQKILAGELAQLEDKEAGSNGEKNYRRYGTAGVRGEALLGYPSLWKCAFPVLMQGMRAGKNFNRVKLQTLFVLMSCTEDSNIIARHDPQTLRRVQKEAADFLAAGGAYAEDAISALAAMDRKYMRENISAGGCADLLAAAIFLQKILR